MNRRAAIRGLLACLVAAGGCGRRDGPARSQPTFGERQLAQLLADRPDMRGALPANHAIARWVAEGFNGDRFGDRVYWLADPPQEGFASQFSLPYDGRPPCIQVTGGTETTPIDKWASLVFEFHNLDGADAFLSVWGEALAGRVAAEDYATECVRLEFEALKRASAFLRQTPLPISDHGRDEFYLRLRAFRGSFEEYRQACREAGLPFGNFEYFLTDYETRVAPHLESTGVERPVGEEVGATPGG